jgi:hypothetical protein
MSSKIIGKCVGPFSTFVVERLTMLMAHATAAAMKIYLHRWLSTRCLRSKRSTCVEILNIP